jgi:nucleotide-binding universal stress UspA family protein
MCGSHQPVIQNMLFLVDFSPSCTAMAAYVKRAAEIFGADVSLVHVCDLSSNNGFELYARPVEEIAEDHWTAAENKLGLFLQSEFPSAKCTRILLAGDAAARIVEAASVNKCDLIMMPTHAGRFRRMFLGSTTAKVLADADCPVLTTQHAESTAPRSLEQRKWICAIGLQSDSERVLRYAQDASLKAGAELSVIHVIQPSADAGPVGGGERARQRLAELRSRVGTGASVSIALGPVQKTLLGAIRQLSADVLVIGRNSQDGVLGRMRDRTYALIRDSLCPVVSV